MGKPDEAVACFKKAVELAPTSSFPCEALAACYYSMGLPDESLKQLSAARKLSERQAVRCAAYEEAVRGRPEMSANLLKTAIASGNISKVDIQRDPVMHFILEEALKRALP